MTFRSIKAGLATLALLAIAPAVAAAADLPRKPIYKSMPPAVAPYHNWSGFYIGLNAGYASGTATWDIPIAAFLNNTQHPNGGMFGVTAGYNWQIGSFVVGIEGDYDWANVRGTVGCIPALGVICGTTNTWLATVRGRFGYAFDRFLPYFTGGVAFGNIKATVETTALGVLTEGSATKTGYAIGGGVEYAFAGNLSAKLEYLYVDLGAAEINFAAPPPVNVSFKDLVFRLGVNYKFGGPIATRW
jgi:outer membrane immunogenic protein